MDPFLMKNSGYKQKLKIDKKKHLELILKEWQISINQSAIKYMK